MFTELAKQYLDRAKNYQGLFSPEELVQAAALVRRHAHEEGPDGYNGALNDAIEQHFGATDKRVGDEPNEYGLYSVAGEGFDSFIRDALFKEAGV